VELLRARRPALRVLDPALDVRWLSPFPRVDLDKLDQPMVLDQRMSLS
jgi:hypothetical protein